MASWLSSYHFQFISTWALCFLTGTRPARRTEESTFHACLLSARWILRRKLNPQQTLGSALLTQAALLTKDSISRTQWTVKFHYLYMWALLALPMWISVTQTAVWTQTAADRIIHAHATGWDQHTAPDVDWLKAGQHKTLSANDQQRCSKIRQILF